MYKVYIIIVLVVLTLMYLNSSKNLNEPFADSPNSNPVSYTDADKNKILQVLKDTYEVDALLNIVQIAKGLQTDGYTVPGKLKTTGDLEVSGKLKVGSNITISSDTNGDVINVGDGTKLSDGKTKINIGKFSLAPNKLGNDEILELNYNKDGTPANNKTIVRFSKDAGDKVQVCVNDDCSKFLFVNAEPNLGFYNNTAGQTGFIGKASVDTVSTNNVTSNNISSTDISTTNIKKLGTNETRIRLAGTETNICAGNNCDNKQFFVKYGEDNVRGGLYNTESNIVDFDLVNNSNKRKFKIRTYGDRFELGASKKDGKDWMAWMKYNVDKIDSDKNDVLTFKTQPNGKKQAYWHQGEGGNTPNELL